MEAVDGRNEQKCMNKGPETVYIIKKVCRFGTANMDAKEYKSTGRPMGIYVCEVRIYVKCCF